MKRLISFLTLIIVIANMCAVSAFAEAAPSIAVKGAECKAGETVDVTIYLENNTGFANIGIEIGYDERVLTLTNAVSASTGATFTKAQSYSENPFNMSWDSASNVTYNGTLVTLTFDVAENANGDYPITVDYYKGRNGNYTDGSNVNYDESFAPLKLDYTNGSISVKCEDVPETQYPSIAVKGAECKAGETVDVTIYLENNTGFANIGIEIGYDERALTLTNAVSASTGATFTKAQSYSENPFNMSWDSASNVTYNGTLVTLTFDVAKNASGDYPITVDYYKGRDGGYLDGKSVNYDENFKALGLMYSGGSVTVVGEEKNTITVDDSMSITLTGSVGEGNVYVSFYRDNKMLYIEKYAAASLIEISSEYKGAADSIRVMWWNDSMKPMCTSYKK